MPMSASVSIVPERLMLLPLVTSRSLMNASLMRMSPRVVNVNLASAPATSLIVELLSNRMSAAVVSMTRSAPRVTVSVPVRSTVPVVVTLALRTSTSALTSSPDSGVTAVPTVVVKVTVPVGASAVSVDGPSTTPRNVTLPLSLLTLELPSTATELFMVTSPSLPLIVPASVVVPVTAIE